MVYMILNSTGPKIIHVAPSNVIYLTASITLDTASCRVGVPLGSYLDTIHSLLYVVDVALYIIMKITTFFSDGAMIYTHKKYLP